MKADVWMPFYIGDYHRDTMHLSTLEHGAYMLLIQACWCAGGEIPSADQALANIAKMSLSDWSAIRTTVTAFFTAKESDPSKLVHKRVMAELQKAAKQREARALGAKKTNEKRYAQTSLSEAVSVAQSAPPSPSPSPSPVKDNTEAVASLPPRKIFRKPEFIQVEAYMVSVGLPKPEAQKFLNYYDSNGWKVGKNPMKDWQAAVRNWKGNYERSNPRPAKTNESPSANFLNPTPRQPYRGL